MSLGALLILNVFLEFLASRMFFIERQLNSGSSFSQINAFSFLVFYLKIIQVTLA